MRVFQSSNEHCSSFQTECQWREIRKAKNLYTKRMFTDPTQQLYDFRSGMMCWIESDGESRMEPSDLTLYRVGQVAADVSSANVVRFFRVTRSLQWRTVGPSIMTHHNAAGVGRCNNVTLRRDLRISPPSNILISPMKCDCLRAVLQPLETPENTFYFNLHNNQLQCLRRIARLKCPSIIDHRIPRAFTNIRRT